MIKYLKEATGEELWTDYLSTSLTTYLSSLVLGLESRNSSMLGKHHSLELYPQPFLSFLRQDLMTLLRVAIEELCFPDLPVRGLFCTVDLKDRVHHDTEGKVEFMVVKAQG